MPCLFGCLALSAPRLVLFVLFLTEYLGKAYQTTIWPFLGFLFVPWTTLAYAVAMNQNGGQLEGWFIVLFLLALLMDFGVIGFRKTRFRRRPPPGASPGPGGGVAPVPTSPRSIEVRGERVG